MENNLRTFVWLIDAEAVVCIAETVEEARQLAIDNFKAFSKEMDALHAKFVATDTDYESQEYKDFCDFVHDKTDYVFESFVKEIAKEPLSVSHNYKNCFHLVNP